MSTSKVLIIFIKNPIPGTAKTRLAKDIGKEQAHHVYLKLLDKTREITTPVNAIKLLYYSDHIPGSDPWSETIFSKFRQKGSDLGTRMESAFNEAFQHGQRVVIIGSDCYELTSQIIEQAFDKLSRVDAVIGPSEDGGYYLLGLSKPNAAVFRNKNWSTDQVFNQTKQTLKDQSFSIELLPELNDIDTLQDLKKSSLFDETN